MLALLLFALTMLTIAVVLLKIGGVFLVILAVMALFYGAISLGIIFAHYADDRNYKKESDKHE